MNSRIPISLALLFAAVPAVRGAEPAERIFTQNGRPEWQWSVAVASAVSSETNGHPRAFLWIPPTCKRLRGVVVGQNNMQEEQIFEHPTFRKTLAELDFGVIWSTPPLDLFFRFDRGAGESFDEMLRLLADESGYGELPLVPVVPLGHSAAASYPWHFGFRTPERILAAVSVSGQWPYYRDQNTPDWGNRTLDGVPGLVTMGEYENAFDRAGVGLAQRAEHPKLPLSMLAEPAGEHFAATDRKISFICLYLRAAARHRLPDDWPADRRPALKPVDPTQSGWLADRGRPDAGPSAPAAPVDRYTGDPKNAFWYFDGELAKAADTFHAKYKGLKPQLLGYVRKDGLVPQRNSHVRVGLRLEIDNDDLTFRLRPAFLDTAPVDWRGLKAGEPVAHAADATKLNITRIVGPIEKLGPDTFALRFYRGGFDNPKRSGAPAFIVSHPGDDTFKPMALEADMRIPLENKDGSDQTIAFDPPAAVPYGRQTLELAAASDAGLPVFFYVREGPAVLDGNTLRFTKLPPRAKFPAKITVVAWQWGRPFEPKVKSAAPVERTIRITR